MKPVLEALDPPYPGPPRWRHQAKVFERSKDEEYWGLFLEQRCGKTPVLIDTVTYLYRGRKIDCFIYVAPNGVHADLATDYLPTFLGRDIPTAVYVWRSGTWATRTKELERNILLKFPGLSVLCVNTESLISKGVRKYLHRLLTERKVLMAIDESIDVSNTRASRTKVAIRAGMMAKYRRILDGTPADATPMGLFSQSEFLKPGCLGFTPTRIVRGQLAFPGKKAFERRYAEWEEAYVGNHSFMRIVQDDSGRKQYRNLDELGRKLARFSSRVTRDQCADMPPKVYEKRTFVLEDEQLRVYRDLRDEARAELRGRELTADLILTRYLRLQQITSNHLPFRDTRVCPDCSGDGCASCEGLGFTLGPQELISVCAEDARLKAFERVVGQLRSEDQVLVWARFRPDVDTLCGWAMEKGHTYVRFDGSETAECRAESKKRFQAGDCRFVFGNPVAGGRGNDFSRASAVIYYSHTWSLRWRRQSEDRAQNLAKKEATLYVDLVAEGTVDDKIMVALKEGRSVSELVMARGAEWALD